MSESSFSGSLNVFTPANVQIPLACTEKPVIISFMNHQLYILHLGELTRLCSFICSKFLSAVDRVEINDVTNS
jgi:hypothetical protein